MFLMWDLDKNIEVSNFEASGGHFSCFYSVDASKNYTITKGGNLVNLFDGLKLDFWRTECPDQSKVPLEMESKIILGPLIASGRNFVLAGSHLNKLYIPYTIRDLAYMD